MYITYIHCIYYCSKRAVISYWVGGMSLQEESWNLGQLSSGVMKSVSDLVGGGHENYERHLKCFFIRSRGIKDYFHGCWEIYFQNLGTFLYALYVEWGDHILLQTQKRPSIPVVLHFMMLGLRESRKQTILRQNNLTDHNHLLFDTSERRRVLLNHSTHGNGVEFKVLGILFMNMLYLFWKCNSMYFVLQQISVEQNLPCCSLAFSNPNRYPVYLLYMY